MADSDGLTGTILAVDDEQMITTLIVHTLEAGGYRVLTAGNGHEALDLCRSDKPDMVLMDIGMPGMDGIEAARRLQDDSATAHIPIIFLTGRSPQEGAPTAFKAGGSMFVRKPFTPGQLRDLVDITMMTLRRAAE